MLLTYYFISLFISFIITYTFLSFPRRSTKDPDINNPSATIYIDDNNVCYRYFKKETLCPNL